MAKKILFILHLPPPIHGSSMMGQYIRSSEIINNSFNSKFINLSTSNAIKEIGKSPLTKIPRYLNIILKVAYELIKFNPEIVYLGINAKGIGFLKDFPIALLTKLFGNKLVLHYHNKGVSDFQDKRAYNFLYKILFKNTLVILLSKKLHKDVSKYVSINNVFFLSNGIPAKHSTFNKNTPLNTPPKLLFLSNLIESKGVYELLYALKLLKSQGFKFICNFVGGEGDISSEKFKSKLESLNIQDCAFYLGKKYGTEKYDIFQSSDIFIFPTYYHNEIFSLVILEAMMFGLPVISTDEGAISDIITDNVTGFIVKKKSSQDLADKIQLLIKNPQTRIKMGENGKEKFLKFFTLEIFEKRLFKILDQI